MTLKDKIETTREDVISLISCAEDYGHTNQIINEFFKEMLGNTLEDSEIEDYAKSVGDSPGYSIEDYEEIKERLSEWKSRYLQERYNDS